MRSNLWSGRDDGAGDPGTRIPRGIGLLVVRIGVDHQREPGADECGKALASQRRIDGDLAIPNAILADGDVAEVAEVGAVGILAAVLAAGRVVVAARAGEIGGITLRQIGRASWRER